MKINANAKKTTDLLNPAILGLRLFSFCFENVLSNINNNFNINFNIITSTLIINFSI